MKYAKFSDIQDRCRKKIDEENEIECPECHNIIELDLNSDFDEDNSNCSGNCNSCGGCNFEENDDNGEDDM